jgi:hypothetical protein
VTEAKAAIWRFTGEQLEDRYNGSWYSIVPSEAQLGVYPILDDPANRIIFYRGYVGSSGVALQVARAFSSVELKYLLPVNRIVLVYFRSFRLCFRSSNPPEIKDFNFICE